MIKRNSIWPIFSLSIEDGSSNFFPDLYLMANSMEDATLLQQNSEIYIALISHL